MSYKGVAAVFAGPARATLDFLLADESNNMARNGLGPTKHVQIFGDDTASGVFLSMDLRALPPILD